MKPLAMSRAAAVFAALALPGGAFAQSAVPSAPSTAPSAMAPKTPALMGNVAPGGMAPRVMPAASSSAPAMPAAVSAKVEAHIKELRAELQITPAETAQWNAFAQVMRDNAAQMNQAFTARGAQLPTMNAVENLQSYSQIAQVQSVNMQNLATSFQALYKTFPASQQKLADAVFLAKASHDKKSSMRPTTP